MRRSLPGCLEAIVTTDTISGQRRMVDEINDGPVCSDVAIRAFTQCRNMAGRFRGRAHDTVLRVAARACRVRRAKRSARMTALAGNVGVSAIEYEASTKMIERLLR